jgi:hypothetical protein
LPHLDEDAAADSLVRQVDSWLGSDPLAALVREYGGDVGGMTGGDLADYLDRFASENWDFRRGAERNQANEVEVSEARAELTRSVADSLGLVGSRSPLRTSYDVVLILGGLVRACVVRPRHVARLLADGLTTDEVVAIGGFRPLAGDEVDLAQRLGLAAQDEFDAMTEGCERAFGTQPSWSEESDRSGNPNSNWAIRSAQVAGRLVEVVAAPSSVPESRRANTVDTYRFFADRRTPYGQRLHALIVTNPVYVPYQGCGALEVLGLERGWCVETVGAGAAASDLGDDTQVFGPQQYLQEIRSAIFGMRNLRRAAADG